MSPAPSKRRSSITHLHRMDSKLQCDFRQCLLTTDRSQRHLRLECRTMLTTLAHHSNRPFERSLILSFLTYPLVRFQGSTSALILIATLSLSGCGKLSSGSNKPILRIGYQKWGALYLLRWSGKLDKRLAKYNAIIEWFEFPSGPPILERLAEEVLISGIPEIRRRSLGKLPESVSGTSLQHLKVRKEWDYCS